MAQMAILYDATRCISCRACQVACKQWNDLEGETTSNWGSHENPRDLSLNTWCKIEMREIKRDNRVDWLFNLRSCFHCTDAYCKDACPVEAIYHTAQGFVIIDHNKCIGCGLCVKKCPFSVMQRRKAKGAVPQKCNACIFRLAEGETPACVKSCPAQAMVFGKRDDLIKDGRERVQRLREGGNQSACLYGEREHGGLHVLQVLSNAPEVYGLII